MSATYTATIQPDGFAVVQPDGYFVGIWRIEELADQIVNRSPSVKGERVRPMRFADTTLDFAQLRAANLARLPLFKNKHGQLAHSHPEGRDWSPAQWCEAVLGELGEYANLHKKLVRGDLTPEQFAIEATKELADVQIYLDILAFQIGVDLGEATRAKFNEVSDRVGCEVKL